MFTSGAQNEAGDLSLHLCLLQANLARLYKLLIGIVVDGINLLILTKVHAGSVALVQLLRRKFLKGHVGNKGS